MVYLCEDLVANATLYTWLYGNFPFDCHCMLYRILWFYTDSRFILTYHVSNAYNTKLIENQVNEC